MTTNPRLANRTRSSISAWVPIRMSTSPEAMPSRAVRRSLAFDAPVRIAIRTSIPSSIRADRGVVLTREYLGRSHHAGLIAVVHGQQHRHQRHEGLAAADVALQQAVHLESRHGVLPDLLDDPLLGSGQREGEFFVVEGVEYASDLRGRGTRCSSARRSVRRCWMLSCTPSSSSNFRRYWACRSSSCDWGKWTL